MHTQHTNTDFYNTCIDLFLNKNLITHTISGGVFRGARAEAEIFPGAGAENEKIVDSGKPEILIANFLLTQVRVE